MSEKPPMTEQVHRFRHGRQRDGNPNQDHDRDQHRYRSQDRNQTHIKYRDNKSQYITTNNQPSMQQPNHQQSSQDLKPISALKFSPNSPVKTNPGRYSGGYYTPPKNNNGRSSFLPPGKNQKSPSSRGTSIDIPKATITSLYDRPASSSVTAPTRLSLHTQKLKPSPRKSPSATRTVENVSELPSLPKTEEEYENLTPSQIQRFGGDIMVKRAMQEQQRLPDDPRAAFISRQKSQSSSMNHKSDSLNPNLTRRVEKPVDRERIQESDSDSYFDDDDLFGDFPDRAAGSTSSTGSTGSSKYTVPTAPVKSNGSLTSKGTRGIAGQELASDLGLGDVYTFDSLPTENNKPVRSISSSVSTSSAAPDKPNSSVTSKGSRGTSGLTLNGLSQARKPLMMLSTPQHRKNTSAGTSKSISIDDSDYTSDDKDFAPQSQPKPRRKERATATTSSTITSTVKSTVKYTAKSIAAFQVKTTTTTTIAIESKPTSRSAEGDHAYSKPPSYSSDHRGRQFFEQLGSKAWDKQKITAPVGNTIKDNDTRTRDLSPVRSRQPAPQKARYSSQHSQDKKSEFFDLSKKGNDRKTSNALAGLQNSKSHKTDVSQSQLRDGFRSREDEKWSKVESRRLKDVPRAKSRPVYDEDDPYSQLDLEELSDDPSSIPVSATKRNRAVQSSSDNSGSDLESGSGLNRNPKPIANGSALSTPTKVRSGDATPPKSTPRVEFKLPSPSYKKQRFDSPKFSIPLSDDDEPPEKLERVNPEDVCPYCGDTLPKVKSRRLIKALTKIRDEAKKQLERKEQERQEMKERRQKHELDAGHASSAISRTASRHIDRDLPKSLPRPRPKIREQKEDNEIAARRALTETRDYNPFASPAPTVTSVLSLASPPSDKGKLSLLDRFEFCRIHVAEEQVVPRGTKENYPLHIDFTKLDARVRNMAPELKGIVKGTVSSVFLDNALSNYERMGTLGARNPHVVLAGVQHTLPGYYGSKGAAILFEILAKLFLETHILTRETAHPQKPVEYIQHVLVPETGVRLIIEDREMLRGGRETVSFEDARKIMGESVEFGNYMNDINS